MRYNEFTGEFERTAEERIFDAIGRILKRLRMPILIFLIGLTMLKLERWNQGVENEKQEEEDAEIYAE